MAELLRWWWPQPKIVNRVSACGEFCFALHEVRGRIDWLVRPSVMRDGTDARASVKVFMFNFACYFGLLWRFIYIYM